MNLGEDGHGKATGRIFILSFTHLFPSNPRPLDVSGVWMGWRECNPFSFRFSILRYSPSHLHTYIILGDKIMMGGKDMEKRKD